MEASPSDRLPRARSQGRSTPAPGPVPVVRLSHEGAVAVLTLDDPDHSNTLGVAMLEGLRSALATLASAPGTRAVVLTGAGRSFCLGAHLEELEQSLGGRPGPAMDHLGRQLAAFATVIEAIRRLPCAVVGALNGQVAGAGLALALACDYRIATERTALNLAYAGLGASPDGGTSWFLPRLIGRARSLELLLSHTVLRGPQALEWGLVNALAPREKLLDSAREQATRYARLAPHTVRAAKTLVDASPSSPLSEHLRHEHALFLDGLRTADLRRGLAARREGGQARFTGD